MSTKLTTHRVVAPSSDAHIRANASRCFLAGNESSTMTGSYLQIVRRGPMRPLNCRKAETISSFREKPGSNSGPYGVTVHRK
jgi:hypothetical protein